MLNMPVVNLRYVCVVSKREETNIIVFNYIFTAYLLMLILLTQSRRQTVSANNSYFSRRTLVLL